MATYCCADSEFETPASLATSWGNGALAHVPAEMLHAHGAHWLGHARAIDDGTGDRPILASERRAADGFVTAATEALAHATAKADQRAMRGAGVLRTVDGRTVPFPGSAGGGSAGSARPGRQFPGGGSWGAQVIESIGSGHGGVRGALLTPGHVAVATPVRQEPIVDGQRARFLRQLIPVEPAPTGTYGYMRQTVRQTNAAAVAKGARKPTSIYTVARVDDRTRTIAHLSEPIPRQDLSDAQLLRQFLDDELRYGLDITVDAQILTGDGVGESMTGILDPSQGIGAQPFDTDVLTTTRKALTVLELLDLVPSGWVCNPLDWEAIELSAAEQFASNSNIQAPVDVLTRRLWGVPVLASNAIAAGTALLGDFRGSSILFETEGVSIDWSESTYDPDAFGPDDGATDFERNMLRFRAEGRWNIAVTRPAGFVAVDLSTGGS